MDLDNIRLQTTWNEAAQTLNSNFNELVIEIEKLKLNGGGGGGDLSDYLTKVEAQDTYAQKHGNPNEFFQTKSLLLGVSHFLYQLDEDINEEDPSWAAVKFTSNFDQQALIRLKPDGVLAFTDEIPLETSEADVQTIVENLS